MMGLEKITLTIAKNSLWRFDLFKKKVCCFIEKIMSKVYICLTPLIKKY